MAVRRYTVGKGQDFEDRELFEGIVPANTHDAYIATFIDDTGKRETPGVWLSYLIDDSWAGGRHDLGTVITEQVGIEEVRPSSAQDPYFHRVFVANGRPGLTPKLHKVPALPDIVARAKVLSVVAETVKGKAELAAAVERVR